MKISLVLLSGILTLLISFNGFSQSQERLRPIKKDNFLIDITYDHLLNLPNGVNYKLGYGNSFQLFYDHQFKAKVLSGALGVGYAHSNYYSNGYITNTDTATNTGYANFAPIRSDSSYKQNYYTTNYIDFPFELRYRSKPNEKGHSWKASVGFRVGVRLGSYTTTRTSEGKYRDYIQPHLTKTRYGLTFRAGYGRVGVMGYYGLTRLFEQNKGREVIPFSVGLTIAPF